MMRSPWRPSIAGWVTLLLVLAGSAIAQPPPALPQPTSTDDDSADVSPSREPNVRRIYVPVTELNALLQGDRQGVLLPRDEFHQLYEAARNAEANALNEPAGVVVTSADYRGQLDGETLRLTAKVRFTQFENGWQIIRLPIGGLSVQSALVDDRPAPISRDTEERNSLLIFSASRGDHQLQLELSLPLKSVGSDWLAEFQTLGAPSGTLTLSVAEGKSLLVDGLNYERSTADDAASDFQVPLGGRSQVELRLTDRDLRNAADALVFAHTAYGVHVAPGEVTWTTKTSVQAYGQSVSQLTFVVPSDLEVASVESTGLEEWVLAAGNRRRQVQLTLTYRQPFLGERDVTIRGVLVPEGEDWTLPSLVLQDADSQVGTIVVKHGPEVRLQAEHDEDVRPVSGDSEPGTLRFQTMNPSFDLDFRTLGKARSVHVAMTNLLDISDAGVELQTVIDVETYFVPLFEVRLTLPADFEVTAANVESLPVEWSLGTGVAGVIEVRIPLDPPLHPGTSRRVSLSAHADPEDWPLERDPALLPFPQIGLPQADMVEARYGIMADDDLEVRTVELAGLDPARQADLTGLRQAATAVGRQLRLGFNYQDTVFSGQLEVTRKPTRLSASTWSLSRLDPQSVHTELELYVTVAGGGTDGLLIELPESTGSDLRFTVEPAAGESTRQRVSIVEQSASDTIDGRRTWALRFDHRTHGDHEIRVSLVEPRPEEGPVTLPDVTLVGAERQNGWIAVEARQDQRLGVQATAAGGLPLPAVDPIDLPGMGEDVSQRRIVAGVRYVQPGSQVLVAEETYTGTPVPTALADRAEGVSVLSETGLMLHRLDVTFRAVGMQSLLFALPEASDVWAVLIDGAPVEVRETTGGYRVPLSAVDVPSKPRSLRLIYRSQESEPGAMGRLEQSPPELFCVTGAGQTQQLEVLEQQWTWHYPRDMVLLGSRGLFSPTTELTGDSWLGQARDAMTLPTLNELGWRLGIVAAIVLLMWVVTLIWRRLGFWSVAVLMVAVPIVFMAVLFYSFAKQETASSEYFATAQPASESMGVPEYGGFAEGVDDEFTADGAFGGGGGIGGGGPQFRGGTQTPFGSFDAPNLVPNQVPLPAPGDRAGSDLSLQLQQRQQIAQEERAAGQPTLPPFNQPQMAGEPTQQATPAFVEMDGDRDYFDGVIAGLPSLSARGALLSLSLDLESPPGSRSTTFRTLAPVGSDAGPAFNVTYGNRSFREALALIIAAGVALLLWWLRRCEWTTKLAWVLATIIVPIAIAPVAPLTVAMIIEGVLLGGLIGVLLWSVRALVPLLVRCCQCCCAPSRKRSKVIQKTTAALLTAVSLFLVSGVAQAQTDQDAKSELLPIVAAEEPPTIVVPYAGDDPQGAERVYLPQKLFRELWFKAYPDRQPRPAAPIEGLVAEALYAVDVTTDDVAVDQPDSTLRVQGRFVLFGFRDDPVWVPLPLDQVAVVSATLDDDAAVLRPREHGQPELLVPSPGMHILDLTFDVSAEVRPASGQFVLPLQPVASGALTVMLPATDLEQTIRVVATDSPAVVSRTEEDAEGRTRISASIDRGGPVRVSWQPKSSRGDRDNLVQVESRMAIDVADTGIEMTADFALQVRQGLLTEVPFSFSEAIRLKRIIGPDVGGWQIAGEGQERTLTIFLRRNVEDRTTITAELFLPQEDRDEEFTLTVPEFAPLGVTRETGQVAVLAGSHLDVRALQTEGLRQLDRDAVLLPASLPPNRDAATSPVQLAYRFASRSWQLELSVRTRPPQTTAECEHGIYLGFRKLLYRSRMHFDLTGAPRQTLRISLTDGFLVTDVFGDGVADWFLEDVDLVIDLGQPRVGRVELILEGHVLRDEGDDSAVIITPLPLDLDRQQSVLAVWVDPVFSATLDSFETWRTIDRAQLPAALRALHSDEPQFAFRSAAVEPEIVGLDLIRRQPQLVADAVTLIAVSDVSVDYGLTLRWTIERAATDLFSFTGPSWLQDQLQITGENIRQTTQELTEDGHIRWSVQLADAVRGQYLLTATATLPPPADGRIVAPDLRFEQPPLVAEGEFTELDSQQSFAVLVNLSRERIAAAGDLDSLIVRRDQLPLVLRNNLIAQAMAIVRLPAEREVVWTIQKVTEQQAQAAQVTAAELTTVLAADGSLRTQATYRVRNRGQQYLALKLPEKSQILSVFVKDQPARCLSAVVSEQNVSLVPLPQTSLADLSFLVQVVVQDRIPDVKRLTQAPLGADYSIPVPTLMSPAESREFGVPVMHTNWTVYVPDDVEASLVDQTPRSNVSYQPPEETLEDQERELFRELADQRKLAQNEKASLAQREKAAYNIDQLNTEISNFWSMQSDRDSSSFDLSLEDRESVAKKTEQLSESLSVAEEVRERATQQLTVESFGMMNTQGQSFITGNSMQILQDNRGSGATIADEGVRGFRFDRKSQDKESSAAKPDELYGKAAASRSKLRGRLESQVPMQGKSIQTPSINQLKQDFGTSFGGAGGGGSFSQSDRRSIIVRDATDQPESQTAADFQSLIGMTQEQIPDVPDQWLQRGGLSLPIDLPTGGQTLTFHKLGGDPRLTLSIRPRDTGRSFVHWLWAVVVFAAGAWLLHQLAHRTGWENCRRGLSLVLIAVGAIALLCLPLPWSLFGGVLLIIGSLLGLLLWQPAS